MAFRIQYSSFLKVMLRSKSILKDTRMLLTISVLLYRFFPYHAVTGRNNRVEIIIKTEFGIRLVLDTLVGNRNAKKSDALLTV